MYSAVGSNTRKNYYVPLQNNDETPSFTKRCANAPMHRAVRILGRKYALTRTGYKFLKIGINVGPPSYVEIAIGDNCGNELTLSIETWKGLYEQRWNIQNCLRNHCKGNSITVGPLTVRFRTIENAKIVCLESFNVRLMMTESTILFMFNLDKCIELAFDQLVGIVEKVDTKFTRFSNISSTVTDAKDIPNVICASDYFDKNQLLDCELLAAVFCA
ncbi:hypothetical protein ALC57_18520 [Trachymyrmex cornetzi]|uniref:Uncharacterized protein n=1 Tax=Trachymyrmex cornetzi TaxID=471704 RepID=A0A151IRQ1_9HYME|nr:hypothetical protein ALC57_18520 [Trachymyrmex cornetzi]